MITDGDWRKWSETDPYFGVVSFPEFKADRIAENVDYFFEARPIATDPTEEWPSSRHPTDEAEATAWRFLT